MAHRLYTGRTLSLVWLTSSWFTNSVGWKLEVPTATQISALPMRWVNGKHGSKPAPAMTKPISWSLPIFRRVPVVFSVGIAIFQAMGISTSLVDLMLAAVISLADWEAA